MPQTKFTPAEFSLLNTSLHTMKMNELKEVCLRLNLPPQGQKAARIARILTFLETGKIVTPTSLPSISKTQKNKDYPLEPKTLILSGSYKNDAATRAFMKILVGEHFHFTAFGQDWIKERWAQGRPPTYAEFATFWSQEYQARKLKKATPKKEWAYLNFVQTYCSTHSHFTRKELLEAWETYRLEQVQKANELLKRVLS